MSGNATLVAVASRSEDKAKQFISECSSYAPYAHLPEAVGSYEALLARQDIEVRGNWKCFSVAVDFDWDIASQQRSV